MRARVLLLGLAAAVLAPAVWRVGAALPAFGGEETRYGVIVNGLLPGIRHVSNMVSAVNFDVRGVDTVGEEFMLLGAVAGAVILLRGGRGEGRADKALRIPGRGLEPNSDAVRLGARLAGPMILVFGLYMTLHAMVTPGGGFQGGVILASGLLLVYLAEGYAAWRALIPSAVFAALEGGGALLFALAGLWPMARGGAYLQNLPPLGRIKDMLSGGLMLAENLGVCLAVFGGFTLLLQEFLEETRAPKTAEEAGE